MGWAPTERESHALTGGDGEGADDGTVLLHLLDAGVEPQSVRAGLRDHAAPDLVDPRADAAVSRPRTHGRDHRHFAGETLYDPDHLRRPVAWRHEIQDADRTGRYAPHRFEDE